MDRELDSFADGQGRPTDSDNEPTNVFVGIVRQLYGIDPMDGTRNPLAPIRSLSNDTATSVDKPAAAAAAGDDSQQQPDRSNMYLSRHVHLSRWTTQ